VSVTNTGLRLMPRTEGLILDNLSANKKYESRLVTISLCFWGLSLIVPALISSREEVFGLAIFGMGWLGFAGVENSVNLLAVLAWWANPIYFIAISRLTKKQESSPSSPHIAVFVGLLTFLLSSFAINAVPSFTKVIGYGPGAILWIFSLLILGYSACLTYQLKRLGKFYKILFFLILVFYLSQAGLRHFLSNESEKDQLPVYAAKRGIICAVRAKPLPITTRENVIEIEAVDTNEWISTVHSYGINKIQAYGQEYREFREDEKNSLEARTPPYMHQEKANSAARYLLVIEGMHPYKMWKADSLVTIKMHLIDKQTNEAIGELIHQQEFLSKGFCPALSAYSQKKNEEVVKWLAPFASMQPAP
jgi:hypothetical protein